LPVLEFDKLYIQYSRHTQSTVTQQQTSSKPEPIDSSQQTDRPELRVPEWEVELEVSRPELDRSVRSLPVVP
jgi:F0F1-type ATP synthase gamma subunit